MVTNMFLAVKHWRTTCFITTTEGRFEVALTELIPKSKILRVEGKSFSVSTILVACSLSHMNKKHKVFMASCSGGHIQTFIHSSVM